MQISYGAAAVFGELMRLNPLAVAGKVAEALTHESEDLPIAFTPLYGTLKRVFAFNGSVR